MSGTATSMMTLNEHFGFEAFYKTINAFAEELATELENDAALSWDTGGNATIGEYSIPLKQRLALRKAGNKVGFKTVMTRYKLAEQLSKYLSVKTGREVTVNCNWRYKLRAENLH